MRAGPTVPRGADRIAVEYEVNGVNPGLNKKLSYRRETARQLHTITCAGQLTF